MNNYFEELKKYFEVTPQDKILEDWAKSAEFDKIGPTFEEFLQNTQMHYQFESEDIVQVSSVKINEYSPEFTSGFFMSK